VVSGLGSVTTDTGACAVPEGLGPLTQLLPTVETVGFLISSRGAGLVLVALDAQRGRLFFDYPLLEDSEMFRVRHGRVISLASALLRMIWV
jgi:hypothetical protein